MNTRKSFLSFSNGRFGVKSSCSVRNRCRSRSPPMQIADGIYADRVRCPCRSRSPSVQIAFAVDAHSRQYEPQNDSLLPTNQKRQQTKRGVSKPQTVGSETPLIIYVYLIF